MRILRLILTLGLAALPGTGTCCQVTTQAEQSAQDAVDFARQQELVKELSDQADLIVVARTISAPMDSSSATFSVISAFKGHASGILPLSWQSGVTVSCYVADMFKSVEVRPGQIYLLYVLSGHILRAAPFDRRYGGPSYAQELQLIHLRVGF